MIELAKATAQAAFLEDKADMRRLVQSTSWYRASGLTALLVLHICTFFPAAVSFATSPHRLRSLPPAFFPTNPISVKEDERLSSYEDAETPKKQARYSSLSIFPREDPTEESSIPTDIVSLSTYRTDALCSRSFTLCAMLPPPDTGY